jgi:uncharacterized protein involved in response to NO
MNFGLGHLQAGSRKPVPRGILRTGPAVLSYGFRPFFLGAGMFAILAMTLWIGALTLGWDIGGANGPLSWHAHEMLFGYTSAALAGFMLTAIPNWTGRLPVAGPPLLGLFALWCAGRLVTLVPTFFGAVPSALIEASFLPVLGGLAAREIIAGRNWKNLRVLAAVALLSVANMSFHYLVATGGDPIMVIRFTVATCVALISLIGGRIIPSFTRNWLVKAGAVRLPSAAGAVDRIAGVLLLLALAFWASLPEGGVTASIALIAALAQGIRLVRWRGWETLEEPLLAVLHLAYAFLPLALIGVAMSAMGWLSAPSVLHLMTVGLIGNMTLAVMTRVARAHTARPLRASATTVLIYLAIFAAAIVRPFAEVLPEYYHLILGISGACWILAYAGFVAEYAPILLTPALNAKPVRSSPKAVT